MQKIYNPLITILLLQAPAIINAQEVIDFKPADKQQIDSIQVLIRQAERTLQMDSAIYAYESALLKEETTLHRDHFFPLLRGLIQTGTNRNFNKREGVFQNHAAHDATDYIPAVSPLAACYIMKGFGLQSRSKNPRFFMAQGLALALSTGITQGLKYTVSENRPSRKDDHSFPSGHTSLAYTCATILHREYGYITPWISIGGYGAATITEVLRLQHNAHYISDIFVGAGIGVASTNFAYYLTDRILGTENINKPKFTDADRRRIARFNERPHSFYLIGGSEINGRSFRIAPQATTENGKDILVRGSSTYTSGIGIDYFLTKHVAVDARLRLGITRLKICPDENGIGGLSASDLSGENLEEYHFGIGASYSGQVMPNMRAALRLSVGNVYNFSLTFRNLTSHEEFIEYPSAHRVEWGGGFNFDMLTSEKYVTGFSCDYSHVNGSLFPNRLSITSSWKILF